MPVNVICVRPTMPLPGQADTLPLTIPPLLIPIEQQPPIMPEAFPLFITDFPLTRISTQYWLATLTRSTYSSSAALFTQAARAVVPPSYQITFVPNAVGLTPGYGVIKFPDFLLVCISGTTNLGQWLSQLFLNNLVPTNYPISGAADNGMVMSLFKSSADIIDAAITNIAGDDRPVLLVGHSMGGAVATTLHYKYRAQTSARKPSRLMTFAAPKPGNRDFATGCRTSAQVLRRFTIQGDPIPGLPPSLPKAVVLTLPTLLAPFGNTWADYAQPGSLFYLNTDGSQEGGSEPSFPAFVASVLIQVSLGRFIVPPIQHLMPSYVNRFRNGFGLTLPAGETSRWVNPRGLEQVNELLTAAGL